MGARRVLVGMFTFVKCLSFLVYLVSTEKFSEEETIFDGLIVQSFKGVYKVIEYQRGGGGGGQGYRGKLVILLIIHIQLIWFLILSTFYSGRLWPLKKY